MAEVSVKNVTKRFGPFAALDDVSMDFPDGGFFALLGPSGSGKTTLLRTIAGFLFTDGGSIHIGKKSVDLIPVEKREIGMMFQNYALFPNMSVADNVGFGLRVRKIGADEERRRIGEVLELVQLSHLGGRKPHQLSGGQRQRVALARAIVTNPRVLLLDEPLSALDKSLRVDMQVELTRIQREIGITTIFVTHDQEEALTLSDEIGILREGRMIQSGPPRTVYNNPVDRFTAEFLGDANIIVDSGKNGRLNHPSNESLKIPSGAETASALAVRPESISISASEPKQDGLSKVNGTLVQRMFAGAMSTCIVQSDGNTYKVVARDQDIPEMPVGENIWLSWKPEHTIVIPRS